MEITLTLTIHADRLAALGDFLLEREAASLAARPAIVEELAAGAPLGELARANPMAGVAELGEEKPTKPKRGRGRPKGAKNKPKEEPEVETPEPVVETPAAPVAEDIPGLAEFLPDADTVPAVEHSEDDVRAAVRVAVESGGLDLVAAVFTSVGADCLSAIKPADFGKVIKALKA